jgi:transcriptional regulator with XRE-family HTH domain
MLAVVMSRRARKPSVIDYRALQARKAYLGLTHEELAAQARCGVGTVTALINGDETLRLATIIKLATHLKLRVRVEFDVMPEAAADAAPPEQEAALRLARAA